MTAVIVALTFTMALVGAAALLFRTVSDERDRIVAALRGELPAPCPPPAVLRFTRPKAVRSLPEWRAAA